MLIAVSATPALSNDTATVSIVPAKAQTVAVDAKSLVRVAVEKDAVTRFEFAKEEILDMVVFSDTKNWEITPSTDKNMLFVKSRAAAGSGNMHIITKTAAGETFTYEFELKTRNTGAVTKDVGYVIRLRHSQKGAS